MKATTIAALAAVAAVSGVAAAYAAGAEEPLADACGGEDLLHERAEEVMQRYGFVYEEPEMTPQLEESLEEAFAQLEEDLQERMSEIGYYPPFGAPSPEQAAKMASVHAEFEAAADELLREHGFVIETPTLSEEETAAMHAELDPIYEELDAAYERCYGAPPHMEEDYSDPEADEVMERYGFVYEEPEMTPQLEESLDAAFAQLEEELQERMSEIGYSPYGAPSPEQAAEMASLYAELEARADDLLREHGFVIEKPQLTEQQAAQMEAELELVYGQSDRAHEPLHGGVSAAADGDGYDQIPDGGHGAAREAARGDGQTHAQTRGSHP